MINKFQQGGKQDAVMQFIQGLAQTLQVDPNQIIQIAQKNPKALEDAVQAYQQTQDMNQAAKAFQQGIQSARRGAKLNYLKSLKHQCADDEELVYYKKGGSVDCGCAKKGGEIEKSEKGPVAKFKEIRKGKTGFDITAYADATGSQGGFRNANKKKKPKSGTWGATTQYVPGKNIQRGSGNNTSEQEKKDKSAKDYYAGKQHIQGKKSGGEVKKDCGGSKVIAKFKAKCGTKMKKHKQGGSLNGIPFMQAGTPKGGIKKEYVLPEYMKKPITGAPTILPGRGYSGLEKPALGLFNMFKTWVKGLPKTLTPADYISAGAGAAGGIGLGYDDTHDQNIRKWITNTEKSLQPPPQTPSKPFIEFIKTNKPKFKK